VATGHGTATGALRVELPTDGTGVVGLAAGSAVIGHVISDAGSAIIGKVGIDQTTPGTTNGVAIAPTNGSAAGLAATVSSAAESSHVMCSAACNAYDFFVTTGAAAGFLLWFDATSAPVDGAVTPNGCISIAATSSGGPPPSTIPRRFSTGLTLVYSTTGCFNQTKSATAFFNARVSQ
jgi:hypothetical protein